MEINEDHKNFLATSNPNVLARKWKQQEYDPILSINDGTLKVHHEESRNLQSTDYNSH